MNGLFKLASSAGDVIGQGASQACSGGCGNTNLATTFHSIANMLIFIVGAISVIMVIVGGLRYAISNGDPKAVEAAKNTVLYAVVGVLLSSISFAIINFVVKTF